MQKELDPVVEVVPEVSEHLSLDPKAFCRSCPEGIGSDTVYLGQEKDCDMGLGNSLVSVLASLRLRLVEDWD